MLPHTVKHTPQASVLATLTGRLAIAHEISCRLVTNQGITNAEHTPRSEFNARLTRVSEWGGYMGSQTVKKIACRAF